MKIWYTCIFYTGARNPTRFAPLSPYIPKTTRRPVVTTQRTYRPYTGRGTYAPTRPQSPRPTKPSIHLEPEKPSKCNTTFDAISVIRSQLFIFKGKVRWFLMLYLSRQKQSFHNICLNTMCTLYMFMWK